MLPLFTRFPVPAAGLTGGKADANSGAKPEAIGAIVSAANYSAGQAIWLEMKGSRRPVTVRILSCEPCAKQAQGSGIIGDGAIFRIKLPDGSRGRVMSSNEGTPWFFASDVRDLPGANISSGGKKEARWKTLTSALKAYFDHGLTSADAGGMVGLLFALPSAQVQVGVQQ